MPSRLDICNQALAEAGCDPLQDWSDETTEGDFLRLRYPTIYERTITTYVFQFARALVDLGSPVFGNDGVTPEAPIARFSFQYAMPSRPRVLSTNALLVDDKPIIYRTYRRNYLTDSDSRLSPITVDYQWRAPEEDMPPYVENYLVLKLAAAIASGIPIACHWNRYIAAVNTTPSRSMHQSSSGPSQAASTSVSASAAASPSFSSLPSG